ncbi:hypothetical protein ABII15_05645 [Streptomyces sp. HUAS MG91]|uniref:Uncharacterized protein n=1 Tax=Streptomyces tabacisoli TaxID=3156398 RepID=A0AAU8IM90_9ACTN
MPTTPYRATLRSDSPLPTTLWFPTSDTSDAIPAPGAVLPTWAIEKIRAEFTHRPGHLPQGLLRLNIGDSGPGVDARIPCAAHPDGDAAPGEVCLTPVILAELHPASLPAPNDALTSSPVPGALDDGWPGFFHRVHRLLGADGLLLIATRQRREHGRLTDPLGLLIAAARTAGFRYLQHIVIAHANPSGNQLVPAPLPDADPGVTHSDLIVLTAIDHT